MFALGFYIGVPCFSKLCIALGNASCQYKRLERNMLVGVDLDSFCDVLVMKTLLPIPKRKSSSQPFKIAIDDVVLDATCDAMPHVTGARFYHGPQATCGFCMRAVFVRFGCFVVSILCR